MDAATASPDQTPALGRGAIEVEVRHDSPDPEATPRRYRFGASLTLGQVLEMIGVPVLFTDDRGLWTVRHGDNTESGTVLAVIEQGAGVAEGQVPVHHVHLIAQADVSDLLDDTGTLHLSVRSTPGVLADVLTAAREGRTPPVPHPLRPQTHERLRQAITAHAEAPGQGTRLEILRQALGGMLMLDATGTEPPAPGSPITNLRLPTLQGPEGMRAIGAFTSNEALAAFRKDLRERTPAEKRPENERVVGFWQPSAAVLGFAHGNEGVTHLLIDPPSPSYAVGPGELSLALAAAPNSRIKDLSERDHSLQEVFGALIAADAHLFVATPAAEDAERVPITMTEGEDELLLAFTSTVEVAAHRADLRVSRLPALTVLRLLLSRPLAALRINPAGPSITLSRTQVWHILGQPRP